jgi:hypothetical protein
MNSITALPRVRVVGDQFRDEHGRAVILRGVNLGGDCKVPYPHGGTNFPTDFSDHRTVSFVGRPFPLEEAHEHLGRLKHWGFNCLRLLTTWEAVEHEGAYTYDEAYLDYLTEVCRLAGEHGLYVFIDFHQDVWSRMTGGDGAPGWIFEALGLDFTKFHEAGAAHVMQCKYDYTRGGHQDENYPMMSWTWNYRLPANGILWTLFWAGERVTPNFIVDGRNVQAFLQDHYLGAMDQVARRVKDLSCVLGFDTLNEPSPGWIGTPLSYRHMSASMHDPMPPRPGPAASPLDQLASARGLAVRVPLIKRDPVTRAPLISGETVLNPNGVSIWRDGCPFEKAGIYRVAYGRAEAVSEAIFETCDGEPMAVAEIGYGPLFARVAATIRAHNPDWAVFAEIDPYGFASGRSYPKNMPARSVDAGHWYDVGILHTKTFDPENSIDIFTGKHAHSPDEIRQRYIRQLGARATAGQDFEGGAPSLVGEFGIPFDLDAGEAFARWKQRGQNSDVFARHALALGLMYDAIDHLLLHSTQWNYTASNRNDAAIGDGWNQEDLSIFSRDQQSDPRDPDSGGRGIEGFCRPYARAVQGRIKRMSFSRDTRSFELVFEADPAIGAKTEIYVPATQYPPGCRIVCMGGEATHYPAQQTILVDAAEAGEVRVTIGV